MTDTKGIAIEVSNLAKAFDQVVAVAGVNFSVQAGELFGFLGPNGAGKTTTINMLTGLARPDAGQIRIGGIDCVRKPRSAQHLIGVVPDESNLYPDLSGFDNLCFCAALYGIGKAERRKRALELLKNFELNEAAGRKFSTYSKGMKRKLTIAAGIIHRPAILFLDEPTTGIDVASARQLRQIITTLNRHGTTIFLTTHYIEEAERLCDRIAFIVKGEIVRLDTTDNLVQPLQHRHLLQLSVTNQLDGIEKDLAGSFPELKLVNIQPGQLRVETSAPLPIGPLVHFLEARGNEVLEARRIRPSLEDIFIEVTGLAVKTMQHKLEQTGGPK